MKKIILILAVIITACNAPVEVNSEASQGAGFFLPQPTRRKICCC